MVKQTNTRKAQGSPCHHAASQVLHVFVTALIVPLIYSESLGFGVSHLNQGLDCYGKFNAHFKPLLLNNLG